MNTTSPTSPKQILQPSYDPGLLSGPRIVHDLPFSDYQRLPGINASLLKNPTTYEMLSYAIGMAALDDHERMLAERSGDSCSAVLERVELTAPRTTPIKLVHLARNVLETDKLSPAQKEIVDFIKQAPLDSREAKSATLIALDAKGLIRYTDEERTEVRLKPDVAESHAYALAIGVATHKAILEPQTFESGVWQQHYVLSPSEGLTTKLALECAEAHPGLTLTTAKIIETARRCAEAVWKHKLAAELLTEGKSEVTAQAWDKDALCWRKIRIDRLPNDRAKGIVDIKTTRTRLEDNALRSEVYSWNYHTQAAFYMDTLAAIEGKPRDHFHIVFVTKKAPFLAKVRELNSAAEDKNFIVKGRDKYLEQLARFSVAWHDEQWEAYENEPMTTLYA